MPKLPQYTANLGGAPVDGGRRASGADFGGSVGEALTSLGGAAQNVGDRLLNYMEQEDQRNVLVEHAKLRQEFSKRLEDAEISGADTDKLREELENKSSALRGTTRTRLGLAAADQHGANTLNAFDTKNAQVKIVRAAGEARNQGQTLVNALGATLRSNPSYLANAEADIDTFVDTFKGRLRPDQIEAVRQDFKQQANVAAVSSLTMMDAKGTLERLEKGDWNLTPQQRQQEIGRAREKIKADESERQNAIRFNEYERALRSQEARDEYLKQIIRADGSFKANGPVLMDSRLITTDREHLILLNERWLDEKLGNGRRSDPSVVTALLARIYAPEEDPRKIRTDAPLLEALAAGKLNASDFMRLRTAAAEQRDPNNTTVGRLFYDQFNTIQRAILGSPEYAAQPLKSSAIINRWAFDVRTMMDEYRKAGKAPADLFNPANKDYVGGRDFLASITAKALAQDVVAPVVTGVKDPTDPRLHDVAVGETFTLADGTQKIMTKEFKATLPARSAGTGQVLMLPKSGITVRWSGKGDKNDLANWEPVESFKPSGDNISPATAAYENWREEAAQQRKEFFNSLLGR